MSDGGAVIDIEDYAQLSAYLRSRGYLSAGAALQAEVLHGGVSNRTVLVRLPDDERWAIKQALSRLRVKAAWFSDPARIHGEALALHWMSVLPPGGSTPELLLKMSTGISSACGA